MYFYKFHCDNEFLSGRIYSPADSHSHNAVI